MVCPPMRFVESSLIFCEKLLNPVQVAHLVGNIFVFDSVLVFVFVFPFVFGKVAYRDVCILLPSHPWPGAIKCPSARLPLVSDGRSGYFKTRTLSAKDILCYSNLKLLHKVDEDDQLSQTKLCVRHQHLWYTCSEMQKVADPAEYICAIFFQLLLIFGPFRVIFGPFWQFWVIFGPI